MVDSGTLLTWLMKMRCDRVVQTRFQGQAECLGEYSLVNSASRRDCLVVHLRCNRCGVVVEHQTLQQSGMIKLVLGEEEFQFQKDDIRQTLLVLLAGSTYQQYRLVNASRAVVPESTFYKIQRILCDGIVECCQNILKQFREHMRIQLDEENRSWVAQLNSAWSHRGWKARQHSFLIRAKDENKVVCAVILTKKHVAMVQQAGGEMVEKVVHQGNYFGTSKGMEGEAAIIAVQELKESRLLARLSHVAADGDSGVPKIFANTPECEHVEVAGDPGHMQKNFMRSLKEAFGTAQAYKGYPYRIGKFYMRCLKRAEQQFDGHSADSVQERHAYFMTLWKEALPHYTRKECPRSCPCNEFYQNGDQLEENDFEQCEALENLLDVDNGQDGENNQHGTNTDRVVREIVRDELGNAEAEMGVKIRWSAKQWLDPNNAREEALIRKITPLLELAGESASEVLFGLNTCLSECSNSRRLVFLRKDRFYYQSYEARSLISAVAENIGRAVLYVKIFDHFGLEMDDADDRALEEYQRSDKVKVRQSTRKRSLPYKRRQAAISKSRIEENIDAAQASKERRQVRAYTVTGNKRLKGVPFARRRGARSQTDLKEMFEKKLGSVRKCPDCGWYYTKNHAKCWKNKVGGARKRQKTNRKLSRKSPKPPRKKDPNQFQSDEEMDGMSDMDDDEIDDLDSEDRNFVPHPRMYGKGGRKRAKSLSLSSDDDEAVEVILDRPRRRARPRRRDVMNALIGADEGEALDDIVDVEEESDDSEWEQPDPRWEAIDYTRMNRAGTRPGFIRGGEWKRCTEGCSQIF